RQLLWLPTSREEKYKAKQAIDTFFTRGGDVLSAAVVYFGAMRMGISGFAATNVVLTLIWIAVALMILRRHQALVRLAPGLVAGLLLLLFTAPAHARQAREEHVSQSVVDVRVGLERLPER